ncbi:MAG TPA: hypothetical protein VJS37_09800 [Terriglobales bacterium]|nr:hypothetical protein [Terriglobales bacterium]
MQQLNKGEDQHDNRAAGLLSFSYTFGRAHDTPLGEDTEADEWEGL